MQQTSNPASVPGAQNPEEIFAIIESIKKIQKQGVAQNGDPTGQADSGAAQITAAVPAAPATPEAGASQIGPFGWVGIAFLCCLVFACAVNIYLNCQKKRFAEAATKQELEALAPQLFEAGK